MALRQLFPSSSLQPQLEVAEQLTQLQASAKQLPEASSEEKLIQPKEAATIEQLPIPLDPQLQTHQVIEAASAASSEQLPPLQKQHDSPRPAQKSAFSSSGLLSSQSYPR